MDIPSSEPQIARDDLDIANLAAYLRTESRDRPVVVVTFDVGQTSPYINVAKLVSVAAGRADIIQIPSDDLTRSFTESLPKRGGAYRGACRVYPVGIDWDSDLSNIPIRMARNQDEIADLPKLLIADVRNALRQHQPPPDPERIRTTAVTPIVATVDDAQALADYLLSPTRQLPTVVVSWASGADQAYPDVDDLRSTLINLADVAEITTLEATWRLSALLPPRCDVYGGVSRVYPIGTAWLDDPYISPLRFANGLRDRVRVTRVLTSDAMSCASRGSHSTTPVKASRQMVTGTVMGVIADRGIVNLDRGNGVLWPELVEPGVAAEQLFCKDMKVTGDFDSESHRIDVTNMRRTAASALTQYNEGDTILVKVATVVPDCCTVELFPGTTTTVMAADVADMDDCDLRVLMSIGETLPALLVHFDIEKDEWLLSVREAGDLLQAVPAPSILTGGPPWLVPARPVVPPEPEPEPTPGPLASADKPVAVGNNAYIQGLRQENQQLADLLRLAESQITSLKHELDSAKTQARERMRRQSRKDKQSAAEERALADLSLFDNEQDQLNFEINLAWARMIQPAEKADYPLRKWQYSPQFFSTLRKLQGVSRDKVVEVIVYVLTGRDVDMPSCDRHALRTGAGGDDAQRVRAGGRETCWRVALQHGTPSARRLHYWMSRDGSSIELASVRAHDDFDT